MKYICAIAVSVLLVSPVAADEKDDAAAAAKKTSELGNYSFKGETKTEMPAMMGGMGDAEPQKFEGKHDKDAGATLRTATHDFATIGGKTVSCPIQKWEEVQEDDMMAGARRMMGMMSSNKPVRAPGSELGKLASKLKKVKKSAAKETIGETECEKYDVEFTDGAAEEMIKDLMPSVSGWLNQIPDAEMSASGKFWVNGDGVIVKYESTGKISASFNGMDLEMSATRTTTIFDIGSTKVEIPEGAKKSLGK